MLIKMYLRKNCRKSGIGSYLSDTYPIQKVLKQGEPLSSLPFSLALECIIRIFEVNQEGLKVNGTHQLLVYDVMGKKVHTTQKAQRFY
jgi:hypothetical protein